MNWTKISKDGALIGQLLMIIFILSFLIILSIKHIPLWYAICAIGFELSLASVIGFNVIKKSISKVHSGATTITSPEKHRGLSLFEFMTLVFSLLGVIISVLGFWYVVKGLDSSDKTYRTSTYLQTYGWTIETDKIFVEHPDMRRYFYNNRPWKSEPDTTKDKVAATAELILDSFDAVSNNQSYFDDEPTARKSWKETIETFFNHSVVLRDIYCERGTDWPYIGEIMSH